MDSTWFQDLFKHNVCIVVNSNSLGLDTGISQVCMCTFAVSCTKVHTADLTSECIH